MDDVAIAIKYVSKRDSSKARGLEFSLSFAQFKALGKTKRCTYTGIPFTENARTLERIDNTKGYVPGNVIAVCNSANGLKAFFENTNNPLTEEKVLRMMLKLKKIKGK